MAIFVSRKQWSISSVAWLNLIITAQSLHLECRIHVVINGALTERLQLRVFLRHRNASYRVRKGNPELQRAKTRGPVLWTEGIGGTGEPCVPQFLQRVPATAEACMFGSAGLSVAQRTWDVCRKAEMEGRDRSRGPEGEEERPMSQLFSPERREHLSLQPRPHGSRFSSSTDSHVPVTCSVTC